MMSRISNVILVGLLALANGIRVQALITPFSNTTTAAPKTSSPPGAPVCCFVVQDTVSEEYWQQYTTTTQYSVVNLTSITTLITPYPSVTSTNYETNVYTTNASFIGTQDAGYNPIYLYKNAVPGPVETVGVLNGSQTVTAGITIASPAAFYVYNTVKIITAPAVTNSKGQFVCGTTSAWPSVFTTASYISSSTPVLTYTETATTTETFYSTLPSSLLSGTKTTTDTTTTTVIDYGLTPSSVGILVTTIAVPSLTNVNSNAESYFAASSGKKPTGVTISLTTPFVYLPSRGATGAAPGEPDLCDQKGGNVDYGYPPQTLVDYLAGNAYYSSQYPGLASCLPGGPSVVALSLCTQAAPTSENAGGDLTSSTIITVTPSEVAAQPVSQSANPTSQTSAPPPVLPSSTTESEGAAASTTASNPAPLASVSSEPIQNSATSLVVTPLSSAQAPGTSTTEIVTPSLTHSDASIPAQSQSSQPPGGIPTSTQAPAVIGSSPASPASSAAAIASAIASAIGASPITESATLIGGTSDLVISGATTVPVNPAAPLSGITTVISGTTNVIISAASTVPVSQVVQSLPGSTTDISGTLNVVIPGSTTVPVNSRLPGLFGSTTVISGSAYVIVSNPTTVPVVLGNPTGAAGSFPGSTTEISGTLNVVIPGSTTVPVNSKIPDLSGVTTVISSSTYVIVSSPETLPVATGTGSAAGASSTAPLQVSSGTAFWSDRRLVAVIGLVGVCVLWL